MVETLDRELPITSQTIDILDNPEQLKVLKDRLQKNDGQLHVIVHPFYFVHGNGYTGEDHYETPEDYQQRMKEYVQMLESEDKPYVIFQEEHVLNDLDNKLPTKDNSPRFIVTTKRTGPYPAKGKIPFDWVNTFDVLNTIGVKNIIVTGATLHMSSATFKSNYLTIESERNIKYDDALKKVLDIYAKLGNNITIPDWLKQGNIPQHCVGGMLIGCINNGIPAEIDTTLCAMVN